jgi:hypothetical protein
VRTLEVTRAPRYEGCDSLNGSKRDAPDDFLILVDGQEIGSTYWCARNPAASVGWGWDDGGLPGESWASWGPRGLSCGHPTREAAEQAQAREYASDPDGYDRKIARGRETRAAEAARREAERQAEAEQRETERRRARLGDDEPGPAVWVLPAFHALYADLDEVRAVSAWFEANGLEGVTGTDQVRVEQRAGRRAAVYERPVWIYNGRSTKATETHVTTVTTDPPPLTAPDRPDLHPLFAEHWPSRFPLIDFGQTAACGKCTRDARATTADTMVPWPCPPAEKAIAAGPATGGDTR